MEDEVDNTVASCDEHLTMATEGVKFLGEGGLKRAEKVGKFLISSSKPTLNRSSKKNEYSPSR